MHTTLPRREPDMDQAGPPTPPSASFKIKYRSLTTKNLETFHVDEVRDMSDAISVARFVFWNMGKTAPKLFAVTQVAP
jgi:hypothetical protein